MKNHTKILDDWSKEVDKDLPVNCPKCGKILNQIRYTYDVDRTTIHLTGAVNETEFMVAECPHCKYKLLQKLVEERHIR